MRGVISDQDLRACLAEHQVDIVPLPMGMRTFQVRLEMDQVQLETMVDRFLAMSLVVDRSIDSISVITSQLLLLLLLTLFSYQPSSP